MNTATSPEDSNQDIILYWEPEDPTWKYYVYMHFAEVVELPSNETREFSVLLNEKSINMTVFSPRYLYTDTLFVQNPVSGPRLEFLLRRTAKSTLPPMINAIETYRVNEFLQSPTDQQDGMVSFSEKKKESYRFSLFTLYLSMFILNSSSSNYDDKVQVWSEEELAWRSMCASQLSLEGYQLQQCY